MLNLDSLKSGISPLNRVAQITISATTLGGVLVTKDVDMWEERLRCFFRPALEQT